MSDSVEQGLSEARKFGLRLVLANQQKLLVDFEGSRLRLLDGSHAHSFVSALGASS